MIDLQSAATVLFFQLLIGGGHSPDMLSGLGSHGILCDKCRPLPLLGDFRPDRIFRRPIIGVFDIFCLKFLTDHRQIRVGEQWKKPFLRQAVKNAFLVEQQHPVSVEIPQVI